VRPNAKKCPECGQGTLRRTVVTHVETVGGIKVNDGTAFGLACDRCGEYDLTGDELAGYQRRAAALVLRDRRLVTKDVVRYARKALGLRQVDLGALLDKSPENISRWETGEVRIPRAEQVALIALLDAQEDGIDLGDWIEMERAPLHRSKRPPELDVPPPRRACG
jgi:putative zinc finger/helix-turn-helix YgiT family protein